MSFEQRKSRIKTIDEINKTRREHRLKNLEKYRLLEKNRYEKNKENILQKQRERYKNPTVKEQRRNYRKIYRQTEKGKKGRSESAKRLRQFWRNKLFEVLGGKVCIKCGYTDDRALQFDHIHGGGAKERRSAPQTYLFFKKYAENSELARKTFQVLCANCNSIRKFRENQIGRYYEKISQPSQQQLTKSLKDNHNISLTMAIKKSDKQC